MSETVQSCPLCGSGHSRFFDKREFRGQVVVNRLCENCGLVYQSPRKTEAESAAFYADEYRLLYEGSAGPTARNIVVQRARAESLLAFTRPIVEKVTRYLDVGCSLGVLLQRFAEAYHCQPVGIEPGEAHRAHACNDGLTVYASSEELEKAGEGHFDLISMAHVLEHLADPVGYLVHLREKLLDPQGWLLIEVPNLYIHESFEIAHLVSYSSHTLTQTVKKAGFEIVRLERHGRPHLNWLALYITLLARPVSTPHWTFHLHPERGVAFKRQVGIFYRHVLDRLFPWWI